MTQRLGCREVGLMARRGAAQPRCPSLLYTPPRPVAAATPPVGV